MSKIDKLLGARKETNPGNPSAYEEAAEMLGSEESPQEEAAKLKYGERKAKTEHNIEHHKAETAEERERRLAAEERIRQHDDNENKDKLSPEEHGEVVKGLVQNFIQAGVKPERAAYLAAQTLYPQTVTPFPGSYTGSVTDIEKKAALDYYDLLKNQNQALAEKLGEAIQELGKKGEGEKPGDPVDQALTILTRYRELGEEYMRQHGIDPEKIDELKEKPGGLNNLTQLGANLDTQIRLMEFQDDQKRKWAKFDAEMEDWKRGQEGKRKATESDQNLKSGVGESAKKFLEAGARAMERFAKRSGRQEIEERAEATKENPKCPECGSELASGGPEGWLVCSNCGRSYPVEEI